MKPFPIRIKEIYSLVVEVEADSEGEAKELAKIRYLDAQKGYVLDGTFLEEIRVDFELVCLENQL